jgi:large subunit ribosomal protein L25
MTTVISLAAEKRETTGKGPARTLRRANKIPAIIYGGGEGETMLSMDNKEITLHYRKGGLMSKLVEIEVGGKKIRVLPRAIQLHPVTDAIEHADFQRLGKDAKVHVMVPVHFLNEEKSIGLKLGGVLNIVRRDIELVCDQNSIPTSIDIDILSLRIGESIHLNDITLPKGVKAAIDRNFTIATIVGRGGKDATEEAKAE